MCAFRRVLGERAMHRARARFQQQELGDTLIVNRAQTTSEVTLLDHNPCILFPESSTFYFASIIPYIQC
jgi:hypothetical protein